ncbi:MAG: acVLRF1 family peptidyl-tRNA hydrolase [Dermatophilaceae bacterium]
MGRRVVEVAPSRLDGWLERFAANNPDGPQQVVHVARFDHDPLGLLLVRRGGYAVGLARAGSLVAHKVGSRYVQSRTAAGGWSQQRFARRRANQADELVGAAADVAVRILLSEVSSSSGSGVADDVHGLVLGGDRTLVAAVLEDRRLAVIRDLPARELYDLPDPRLDVLRTALVRSRAVRVTIEE